MARVLRNTGSLLLIAVSATGLTGLRAALAEGSSVVGRCRSVHASGGDYSSGSAAIYAELLITNTGSGACTISGRPWIQLPRLAHPVTVSDWTGNALAGRPGRTVTIAHGQHAHAYMLIVPGGCNRAAGTTFTLWAHAGWADKGVTIVGPACNDGTGEIEVGSFER
jgi:hypothetical protein